MLVTRQPVLRRFWYAILPLHLLDDGPKPFTLLGEKIVLWKQADGTPAAVQDRCCHRTAQLSKGFVEGNHLVCGYHGWAYDGGGRCVRIPQNEGGVVPSNARVTAYACQARYGYAWVCLGEPLRDIPEFPEETSGRHRRILQFYQRWKTSPVRVMENSFDNSHFSYVHKANFGILEQPKPAGYRFDETDYGFEAETLVPIRNPPESFRVTGTSAPITHRHLINRYYLPFSRRFGCHYPDSGIDHIIYNCATPIDDENIMLAQWLYRSDTEADCSAQELIDWDAAITAEDRDILEATDPDVCIDINRRVEVHMSSDKPGLIIRRQLLALLQAHGEQEVFRDSA